MSMGNPDHLPAGVGQFSASVGGQAVDANSTRSLSPWFDSTGLRTSGLRFRSLGTASDDRLAEQFLVNTRLQRNHRENDASILHYFEDGSAAMLSLSGRTGPEAGNRVALPAGPSLHMELGEAVRRRRSVRTFTGDPLSLEYLAPIVRAGVGFTGTAEVTLTTGETATLRFRATPSGGGLCPVQMHVAALNVRGLEQGVYRYDPWADVLRPGGGAGTARRVAGCIALPEEVLTSSRAAAILLLVAKPWRSMRKYGARGMRLVFMEAGYISQNVHLATTAIGFGSVDCSGMYDDEANEALGLDGVHTTLVHAIVIGCPA